MKTPVTVSILLSLLCLSQAMIPAIAQEEIRPDFRWHDDLKSLPLRHFSESALNRKGTHDFHLKITPEEPRYQQKRDPMTGNIVEETYQMKMDSYHLRHVERRDPLSGESVEHSLILDF